MKKTAHQAIALLLLAAATTEAGCAKNAADQARQQAVRTQQAQNQVQPQAIQDNRIQIANQAADKITKVTGVRSANVLITRRNAYVAAVVNTTQGRMTPALEKQIADQVRAADPTVQNVYVSTNPEFVDRVNRYVTDVQQGHPVAGFFDEFTQMVQRIFPSAR